MTRTFLACHKIDHVLKVTKIIESFQIWSFWKGLKLSILDLEDFHEKYRCIYYQVYINQNSLTSVKVTVSVDIYNKINGMYLKIHINLMFLQL